MALEEGQRVGGGGHAQLLDGDVGVLLGQVAQRRLAAGARIAGRTVASLDGAVLDHAGRGDHPLAQHPIERALVVVQQGAAERLPRVRGQRVALVDHVLLLEGLDGPAHGIIELAGVVAGGGREEAFAGEAPLGLGHGAGRRRLALGVFRWLVAGARRVLDEAGAQHRHRGEDAVELEVVLLARLTGLAVLVELIVGQTHEHAAVAVGQRVARGQTPTWTGATRHDCCSLDLGLVVVVGRG